MAEKTITELQLKSSVVGDESLPVDNGIQTYRVTPSQMYDYIRTRIPSESYELGNITIVPSVNSSALTIAIKNKAAADATTADPIRVGFRSATLTSGTFNLRTVTGALSLVISSGSTLGQISAQPSRLWVYLIDNAGTVELAASHSLFSDNELVSTTAEGGAGAADSATVMYSTASRSSVPCRLIGYIDNTQSTAGTWASAGSNIQLVNRAFRKAPTIQTFTSGSGTYITPAGCTRIRVRLAGGGGGGAGGATTAANNGVGGSTGGDTTFGSSLLTGSGGVGGAGTATGVPGAGGAATINSPAFGLALPGGYGAFGGFAAAAYIPGGKGGDSPLFGGGGRGGRAAGANGVAGLTNSGGGGAGGHNGDAGYGGSAGGSGGCVDAIIVNPLASYAYAVGALGALGAAGTSGAAGLNGGSGVIHVEEFYD